MRKGDHEEWKTGNEGKMSVCGTGMYKIGAA